MRVMSWLSSMAHSTVLAIRVRLNRKVRRRGASRTRFLRRMLAAAALTPLLVASSNGDEPLFRGPEFPAGDAPTSVTTGDFNGDGVTDLAIANYSSDTVSVLLNQSSGGGVVEVVPASLVITRGEYVSGGISELADNDNMDLSLRRLNSDIQSRTEFEVKSVSPTASPTSLEVTLEGAVFARSTVNQTIELWDYVAGVWEQVDSRAATRFIDSTVTVNAMGDLSRFVEAGTICIKARIRYQSLNPRQRFSSNTDQFIWTIGQ